MKPALSDIPKEDQDSTLTLRVGEQRSVRPRLPPVAIGSASPTIVVVEGKPPDVVLRGVGVGVTDVVIRYAEGPPDVYVVKVER